MFLVLQVWTATMCGRASGGGARAWRKRGVARASISWGIVSILTSRQMHCVSYRCGAAVGVEDGLIIVAGLVAGRATTLEHRKAFIVKEDVFNCRSCSR